MAFSALNSCRAAAAPRPEVGEWAEWRALLVSRQGADADDPNSAMTVATADGFGTVSSSLIALPKEPGLPPVWLFAPGRPDETSFEPVDI